MQYPPNSFETLSPSDLLNASQRNASQRNASQRTVSTQAMASSPSWRSARPLGHGEHRLPNPLGRGQFGAGAKGRKLVLDDLGDGVHVCLVVAVVDLGLDAVVAD